MALIIIIVCSNHHKWYWNWVKVWRDTLWCLLTYFCASINCNLGPICSILEFEYHQQTSLWNVNTFASAILFYTATSSCNIYCYQVVYNLSYSPAQKRVETGLVLSSYIAPKDGNCTLFPTQQNTEWEGQITQLISNVFPGKGSCMKVSRHLVGIIRVYPEITTVIIHYLLKLYPVFFMKTTLS